MSDRLSIVLSGMLAGVPNQGGATWAVLQYLLGLRELGHRVTFIEPVAAEAGGIPFEQSQSAHYFSDVCAAFGLGDSAALLRDGTRETIGLPYDRLVSAARDADLLINIAGMLTDANLLDRIPTRLYLDLDPAFTQLWHEAQGIDMHFDGHTHFATVGLNIGHPDCPVPTGDRTWLTTRQPIVLSHWPVAHDITCDALTTVANWRGYGSVEHNGVLYGQKAHSIRAFFELPGKVADPVAIALAIHPDEVRDLAEFDRHGWHLFDPAVVASTPENYQAFIQGSRAEIGFAKSGYVQSQCGWFSDRSVCYLASGRPVIAQETGFSRHLPTSCGLHVFESIDDIATAAERIRANYPAHARAARELAEQFFDSRLVLTSLLERIGSGGR